MKEVGQPLGFLSNTRGVSSIVELLNGIVRAVAAKAERIAMILMTGCDFSVGIE